jgi:hypothetical protein
LRLIVFIILITFSSALHAEYIKLQTLNIQDIRQECIENQYSVGDSSKFINSPKVNKRTTLILTIMTGLVGGHRLYLGTNPVVPVFYAVTLGGGLGILPFIDFVVIAFSDDMERFQNNEKIFMWSDMSINEKLSGE